MVRRKIEMVAIEDKSRLQVTFSKRRSGLMKKARELSVLCNVDVGLVIFSPTGRAHEFFSGNSLERILQLHPRPIDAEAADGGDRNLQKTPAEGMHLPKDTNLVESVQSMFEGHKVEHLDVTEVTQLERLLDNMLQRTRTRKAQLMMDSVAVPDEKIHGTYVGGGCPSAAAALVASNSTTTDGGEVHGDLHQQN